jgi:hypothetical protein
MSNSDTMNTDLAAPAPSPRPRKGRRLGGGMLLVGGIAVLAAALNFVWLSFDATPPHWDAANHLLSALEYRELLASAIRGQAGGPIAVLKQLVHVDKMVYPPLFPLTAGVVSPSEAIRSLIMVNSLFLAILVFSVYQIGRRLHGEQAGIFAAVLIAAYPMVMHLARDFMVDYSLLAMTALSAALIVSSDGYRIPVMTFLFGLSTAPGLLSKPTYASFIVVPAAYTLAIAARRLAHAETRTAQIRGLTWLAAGLALGGLVTAVWYLPNWETVRGEAVRIANSNPIGFDVLDANALVYYLNILMIDQIGLPFMAVFIVGAFTLRRHVGLEQFGFLLSWVVGLYLIATFAPYKGTGQDVAILIPIAVISAIGLVGLTRFRVATCTAVVAFAVAQAIVLSLPASMLAARLGTFRWAGSYQSFPDGGDWQFVNALRALGTQPLTLRIMSDDMHVNGLTAKYFARSQRLPFEVIERYGAPASEVRDADAVLAKSNWTLQSSSNATTRGRSLKGVNTASLGVMYTRGTCEVERPDEPLANRISAKDVDLQSITEEILRQDHPYVRRFPLPDGSDLVLYSKRAFTTS